ncbi:MAG: type 4a pilus biogenesis protein PilO [Actinomycetota bacterium]|nr:type 4a pilus biogenesis protein PilO [Actinomycetota bacterium]
MRRYLVPLVGAVAAVVLIAGFVFLLYRPAVAEQRRLERETAKLGTRQQELRNQISRLREIKADAADYRRRVARLAAYIPVGVQQPSAVEQLQAAADGAGVDVDSVTFATPAAVPEAPEPSEADTVLAQTHVSLSVSGTYFQLVEYFRRLEYETPRAVLVQQLSFNEGEGGFPTLSVAWSGEVFSVLAADEVAADAAAGTVEEVPADAPEEDTGS